jgi:glycosyltransferase involved in cell wall biosynthesis
VNFGINDEDVVVLFIGQLRASKGIPVLLDAAQMILESHPRTKFIIVGRGPMEPYLRNKVVSCGLERAIAFTGYLSDSELAGLHTRADLLVLPSFVEGVPRVMLDAMAAGRPVVASDVGSVSDYLKNGVNGLLVKPGDPGELAKALGSLISDESLRNEMGANGKRMLAGLSWDTVARQYLEEMNRAKDRVKTKQNLRN